MQNFTFPVTFTTCPLPTIWAHCNSDRVDEGVDWTGLCCWLGFCSGKPAAFLLWAAIWDKTLSALPPKTKNRINPVKETIILKCLLTLKHSRSFKNWLDEAKDNSKVQICPTASRKNKKNQLQKREASPVYTHTQLTPLHIAFMSHFTILSSTATRYNACSFGFNWKPNWFNWF